MVNFILYLYERKPHCCSIEMPQHGKCTTTSNQAFCEEPQCRYSSLSYKLEIYKWKQWPKSKTQIVRIPIAHVCGFLRWYKSLKKGIKFTPLFNISSYSACRALPCLSTRRQSKQLWAHVKLGTLGFDYLYPLYDAFVGFLRSSSWSSLLYQVNVWWVS